MVSMISGASLSCRSFSGALGVGWEVWLAWGGGRGINICMEHMCVCIVYVSLYHPIHPSIHPIQSTHTHARTHARTNVLQTAHRIQSTPPTRTDVLEQPRQQPEALDVPHIQSIKSIHQIHPHARTHARTHAPMFLNSRASSRRLSVSPAASCWWKSRRRRRR